MNNKEKEMIKIEELIKDKEKMINSINERINEKENYIKNIINNDIKRINEKIDNNKTKEKQLIIEEINIKMSENINNKLVEIKNDINNKLNDKIDNNKIKELNDNINNKYNELKDYFIRNIEYINKLNYKFKKEPQNLKYKLDITNQNNLGWNDIFEIFISFLDNKEYIVFSNKKNKNLEIFTLLDNKIILSLKGHNNFISSIRYFINKKNNNNEYLISADNNKIVIIWDITNNYNIKYQIDTKYGDNIYSCLLMFPNNIDDNYIITSTFNKSDDIDKSATKIYSLNNGEFIKYINNTSNNEIYYLLSWYNKKNNKYYIIHFSCKKIIINNLIEEELYSELKQEPENNHLSGCIYNRDNNDYLCSSSYNGYINIWDLYNKKIFKIINTNKCALAHIINWNNKYLIVANRNNKSLKIIDLEENKIIADINGQHNKGVLSIKKINHPIYGESLLSAGEDNTIKLWTIN